MEVVQVEKRVALNKFDTVKYQLFTHCYLSKIRISDSDLDCLTLLALEGPSELSSFCNAAYEKEYFSSAQSVRNCLNRVEKKKLIIKEGKNRKKIYVNPKLDISVKGNILLDYKFLSVEALKS